MASSLRRRFRRQPKRRLVDPESEGKLLATTGLVPKVALLPDAERVFVYAGSETNQVHLISISSGECLGTSTVSRNLLVFMALGGDMFVYPGYSSSMIAHRSSDDRELDRFQHQDGFFTAFASLGDGYFLAATSEGKVLEMQWGENHKLRHNRTVTASSRHIGDISVNGNRFAICSLSAHIVSVFDTESFELVGSTRPYEPVCVHISGTIFVAGCQSGTIFIYDADTFHTVRDIRIYSKCVRSVHVMSDMRILSSADASVTMHDITTGASIWQKQFNIGVFNTIPLLDGRLVSAFQRRVVVHNLPQDEPEEVMILPSTPLRDALVSCVSGAELAAVKCQELITPERCRTSFDEWCCAHQLLMMAIEDGDIHRSRDFNGEISWWFENLYVIAKDVPMGSNDDIRAMKRFLVQAKELGVVEGVEPVLTALRVTQDLMTEVRALKRADILMLERMLHIEARLDRLKESFDRYRKYMRNSQLLGVALQIIPIAGGSVAGIVSAGAEILEGLSAKDVTDYLLGFGSNLLQDDVSSMSDRVFSSAAAALSPLALEKMNAEYRLKLEQAVASCGLSLSELRKLFVERARHTKNMIGQDLTRSAPGASDVTVEAVVEEVEEEVQTRMLETGNSEVDIEYAARSVEETSYKAKSPTCRDTSARIRPSSWRNFEFGMEEIMELSQEEVASLWAAHIVRSDDRRQGEYEELQDCLLSVLREERLYADLIVDSSAVPSEELVQLVVEKMQENGIRVAMGVRVMLREVLGQIQRER